MDYIIVEHVHRLAAWPASRAASTSTSNRLWVEHRKCIIEMNPFAGPDILPQAHGVGDAHRAWRNAVIAAAQRHG